MLASTGYKSILRYLYYREDAMEEKNVDLQKVLLELSNLDYQANQQYGLSKLGSVNSFDVQINLAFLHERGLINYDPSNPHVELTEMGRCFASCLEFPEEIENALPSFIEKLSCNR